MRSKQNRNPHILDILLLKSKHFSIHQKPLFELVSDHLPVKISVGVSLSFSIPINKLINGKLEWKKFKQIITQNIQIP